MKKLKLIVVLLPLLLLVTLTSCKKDQPDNWKTLQDLYDQYRDGEILECTLNGETVYECGINAYDAGSIIYNAEGQTLGSCNYAWEQADAICGQLQNCEAIYRCAGHISGEPAVDKYGLGD